MVKRSFFWYSDGNDLVKKNLMYAMMPKTAETIFLSRLGSDMEQRLAFNKFVHTSFTVIVEKTEYLGTTTNESLECLS